MRPAIEFEIALRFLPNSIENSERALRAAKTWGRSLERTYNLLLAITWLRCARSQLAIAESHLPRATWCGVGHSKPRRRRASRK
jgi:hypothetical protein